MVEHCAGVLVWKCDNEQIKFFVCTPGGPFWKNKVSWNFPKGHIEDNESDFAAAIREFKEETNVLLSLDIRDYSDLGIIAQSPRKFVHVYAKRWTGEKLDDTCFSNTFVWERNGKEYPEIGKYAWMTANEIKTAGGVKAYYNLFENFSVEN